MQYFQPLFQCECPHGTHAFIITFPKLLNSPRSEFPKPGDLLNWESEGFRIGEGRKETDGENRLVGNKSQNVVVHCQFELADNHENDQRIRHRTDAKYPFDYGNSREYDLFGDFN